MGSKNNEDCICGSVVGVWLFKALNAATECPVYSYGISIVLWSGGGVSFQLKLYQTIA